MCSCLAPFRKLRYSAMDDEVSKVTKFHGYVSYTSCVVVRNFYGPAQDRPRFTCRRVVEEPSESNRFGASLPKVTSGSANLASREA
jgi:hypothetical protein